MASRLLEPPRQEQAARQVILPRDAMAQHARPREPGSGAGLKDCIVLRSLERAIALGPPHAPRTAAHSLGTSRSFGREAIIDSWSRSASTDGHIVLSDSATPEEKPETNLMKASAEGNSSPLAFFSSR